MSQAPPARRATRPQPTRGELTIESSDDGHVIASFHPVLIAVFTRVPSNDELDRIARRAKEALEAGVVGGMLYVVARKDMSGGVDPRVRSLFERMMRENQARAGSNAVVVLTTGFASAVVRGALTGLLALSERRNKLRVFSSIADATAWLAPEHGLDAHALQRACETATRHLQL